MFDEREKFLNYAWTELENYTGRLHFLTLTFAETFAEPKLWSEYLLRPKLSRTNLAKVGLICMEEIALALRA